MPFSQLILRVSGFGFSVPGFCFRVFKFKVQRILCRDKRFTLLHIAKLKIFSV